MFLVDTTVDGAVGKFWILAFLEALKRNLMISKKALVLYQNVVGMVPLPPALTVSLFYLYSCANITANLI